MKTAVLISGEVRTLEQCAPSIERHLLRRLGDYEIFAHVALDEDAAKLDLLPGPITRKLVAQPVLEEANYVHRTGRGVYGIQGVIRQLWSLQESMGMVMEHPYGGHQGFTHAVRLRPDTYFLSDIEDPATWQMGVHIPTFFNFYGLNDRFAFGDFWSMVAYHDRFSHLDEQMARGCIFHPETMLKEHLEHENVPVHRTAILFDTVRKGPAGKPGARLAPAWNAGADYGDIPPA